MSDLKFLLKHRYYGRKTINKFKQVLGDDSEEIKNIIDMIKAGKNKKNTDKEVYLYMHNLYSKKYKKTTEKELKERAKHRVDDQISVIFNNLDSINISFSELKKEFKKGKYLDVGTMKGVVPYKIARFLGFKKANIHGTNIEEGDNNLDLKMINKYMNFEFYDGTKLTEIHPRDSIDLLSCFQVLHHVSKLDPLLKEIAKTVKPNGYFLIREHNCTDIATAKFLDFVHALFEVVMKKEANEEFFTTYYARYKSRAKWIQQIEKHGFKKVDIVDPELVKYSVQKIYYELFQKT